MAFGHIRPPFFFRHLRCKYNTCTALEQQCDALTSFHGVQYLYPSYHNIVSIVYNSVVVLNSLPTFV